MSKLFPIINNIKVDLKSLISIKHECIPEICKEKYSCCASYGICIEKKEVDKIIPHMPEAAKFAPRLKKNGEYINVFDNTEDNLLTIDTDNNNLCMFAWRNRKGETLCSLHSQAIKNDLSFYDIKPEACCLWPLAICSSRPTILSVQDDAFDFECNKKRTSRKRDLDKGIASIIKNIYGVKMLEGINHALSKI